MNWARLWAVMLKELRQMRRDRVTLAMIVGIPVMQLLLFGYAINMNVRGLDAGIADQANTAGSRALVMDMLATGVIKPTLVADTPQQLMDGIRRGEISVGVAIPHDYERRRLDGREAVQVLVDGSDSVVQAQRCSSRRRRWMAVARWPPPPARARPPHSRSRWSASTTRSDAPRSTSCPA